MGVTVTHALSATTPDDPAYEIRPSHWNSNHAITFAQNWQATGNTTQSTSGSGDGMFISGAGIASVGVSNNSLIVSVPAGAPSPVNFSAGTTSNNLGSVVFSDSNGIGFGLNGSTITASHNGLTSQSNQAFSAVGGSSTFQTLSFANANGVTFSNIAGSVLASYTRNAASNAIASVGSATNSGTNTSRFAADDHVHAGVFSMGVSTAGNTVGDTRVDVGRFVLQGGNNVTLSQITAANALNTIVISGGAAGGADGINALVVNGGVSTASTTLTLSNSNNVSFGIAAGVITATATFAQSNQTGGIYVTAQSTGQSSSSTYDLRTLSIQPDGIISAGWSNGSFRISATQSNQAFSAAGGSSAFQTLGFSDNAYASWTNTNGSVALTELRGSFYATSNTTQSSSGTMNIDSIIFAGAGVASVGVSNGSIVVSVPSGGGGDTFTYSGFDHQGIRARNGAFIAQIGQGSLYLDAINIPNIQFDRFVQQGYFSNATNSSGSATLSLHVGVYTRNASTLSLYASTSFSTGVTMSGTVGSYTQFSAIRNYNVPWTTTLTQGNYWMGIISRTTTGGANMSFSNVMASNLNSDFAGYFGVGSNTSAQIMLGVGRWSTTSTALPNSVAFTDVQGTGSAFIRPLQYYFASGTF